MNFVTASRKFYHGVSYYPDLWPDRDIDRDIGMMQDLGINMVRMADFAWAKMEPTEGRISLEFYLRVMDKLHLAQIGTVFCTPTAGPPIWLTHNHPDRCFTLPEGTRMTHGSRQHASYDHPYVRAACMKIADAIGKSIGKHPGLIALQIDNELKCHVDWDFNEHTIAAWRKWLEKRYGVIDKLNDAWVTGIWSMRYERFDQVPAPTKTPFAHNTSLVTAWQEFTYERIAEFSDEQATVLRRHSSVPITHNIHMMFPLNFERVFKNLDFTSFDVYSSHVNHHKALMACDMLRAAKPRKAFWVMETSVLHNGWSQGYETIHPKGYLPAQVMAFYASGAQTTAYWLWKQMPAGCEMPHSAILSSWGKPTAGYEEVKQVSQKLDELTPLLGQTLPEQAQVGITWSDMGRMMMRSEPLGMNAEYKVDYNSEIEKWMKLLIAEGLPRDVVFESLPLTGLKLLITPYMPSITSAFLAKATKFVEEGGTWIAGPLTGHRTGEQTVPLDAALGKLEVLAGIETVYSLPITGCAAEGEAFGTRAPLSGWCHAMKPVHAATKVIGKIIGSPADGLAFITEKHLGRGRLVVLGAEPQGDHGSAQLAAVVRHYADMVTVRYHATPGTLVFPRITADKRRSWIAINMDGQGGTVTLPSKGKSLAGTIIPAGEWKIGKYAVEAVELE